MWSNKQSIKQLNVPSLFERGGIACGERFYSKKTVMLFHYKDHLKKYSQANRKTSTKSEGLVWNMILKGDRTGYRFLRQKPIEGYILDFYCPKLKLGIEIDGESHENKGTYDKKRDNLLHSLGIKIIRYNDNDVLKQLEVINTHINAEIKTRFKELNPPSAKADTSPFQ